jgi:hypothetical protein
MLDKDSVLNAQNICGNPIHSGAETAKSSVSDYRVSLSDDRSRLVPQRLRYALDEVEQPFTTRRDMSTVLNVVWRPVALSRRLIALVEECVERFHDEDLILFGRSLRHVDSLHS